MQPETPSKPKGLSGADVANAAELVSYQDGSIVSREIVKRPTGNVTIFAFDEGQGLSEHKLPAEEVVEFLGVNVSTGLSADEVQSRQKGIRPESRHRAPWHISPGSQGRDSY